MKRQSVGISSFETVVPSLVLRVQRFYTLSAAGAVGEFSSCSLTPRVRVQPVLGSGRFVSGAWTRAALCTSCRASSVENARTVPTLRFAVGSRFGKSVSFHRSFGRELRKKLQDRSNDYPASEPQADQHGSPVVLSKGRQNRCLTLP